MCKTLLTTFSLIFLLNDSSIAQTPVIKQVNSFYKTTSGAIGPSGIISTTTYDITLESPKTLILDSALIAGVKVYGDGIIIPTNRSLSTNFLIRIYTHQKGAIWYNGEIILQGVTVSAKVEQRSNYDSVGLTPKIIMYLKTSDNSYRITKQDFDKEQSQYNK